MPLFEVAILERPTKKEAEDGKGETLVFGPKAIVAADQQSAGISAVMAEDTGKIKVDRSRMVVLVRPFG